MYKVLLVERSSHSSLLISQITILKKYSISFIALVSHELLSKSPDISTYSSDKSLILANNFSTLDIINKYPLALQKYHQIKIENVKWGKRIRNPSAMKLINIGEVVIKINKILKA